MNATSSQDNSVDSTCQELVEIWGELSEEGKNDLLTITGLYAKGISNQAIIKDHLHTLSAKGREAFIELHGTAN